METINNFDRGLRKHQKIGDCSFNEQNCGMAHSLKKKMSNMCQEEKKARREIIINSNIKLYYENFNNKKAL